MTAVMCKTTFPKIADKLNSTLIGFSTNRHPSSTDPVGIISRNLLLNERKPNRQPTGRIVLSNIPKANKKDKQVVERLFFKLIAENIQKLLSRTKKGGARVKSTDKLCKSWIYTSQE